MKKVDNEIKEKIEMYSLPVDTMNEIIGYLAEKPYKEVAHLIQKILKHSNNEK